MRLGELTRKTTETNVEVSLNLDGSGVFLGTSGVGFLDHMLHLFARHGQMDLTLNCVGDIEVDDHHSIEDIGICIGAAFKIALGDKKGVTRYGEMHLPMDEALYRIVVDVSGRGHLAFNAHFSREMVGDLSTEMVKEFFIAFTRSAEITLHIHELCGENTHHKIEAIFKGVAHALKKAVTLDTKNRHSVLSTKGVL